MDIRFISTLTPEDEDHYAPAVLAAVQAVLDRMPLAYTVRIRTTSDRVFEHVQPNSPGLERARQAPEGVVSSARRVLA